MSSRDVIPAGSSGAWPTFIIIGAPKAGTTSAYHYLDQHPEVFMSPVKEPHYFSITEEMVQSKRKSRTHRVPYTLDKYRALFGEVTDQKAIGEASTGYLLSPIAAEQISASIPHAKILVLLRNPADRAFSGYMMKLRNSKEKSSLEDAFVRGKAYVENSFYYENLLRYYERFSKDQIGVYIFEEFREDPVAVMRRMYEFVGVDNSFQPSTHHYHKAWMPKNMFLNDLRTYVLHSKRARDFFRNTPIQRIFRRLTRKGPLTFPEEARHKLLKIYRKDIDQVEVLTGLDLSIWQDDKNFNHISNQD